MIPLSIRLHRLVAGAAVLCAFVTVVGHAQSPPRSMSVHFQDSVFGSLILPGTGDTISPFDVWAGYSFENTYGDSGNVFFTFTEARANWERIELENWHPFAFIKDSTASALSAVSRTRPFTVEAGDTISYYREFSWQNPNDMPYQRADNFYSDDTLEYVIRLRKVSDNTELAVLDSVGVLAQSPAGSPTFYGTGLPMAIREYMVPGTVTTATSVYLSIDVRATGSGDYYTGRSDQVMGKLSEAVTNPLWSEYFLELVGVAPKRVSERLEVLRGSMTGTVKIVPNPSTSGEVRVIAKSRSTGERRSILVFSMDGKVIYSYTTVSGESDLEVSVRVADPGSYYVVSMVGSEIVGMDLLNVVR